MSPHQSKARAAWAALLGILMLAGCGLGGLEGSLYDGAEPAPNTPIPPDALTTCQPGAVRCVSNTWYERCDDQGEVASSGACGWDELCAVGAGAEEAACLSLGGSCDAGQSLRLTPDRLSFKDTQTLKATRRTALVTNCGPRWLVLDGASVIGRPTFQLTGELVEALEAPEGLLLAPGEVLPARVVYQPSPYTSDEEGELRISGAFLASPSSPRGEPFELRVPLQGRSASVLPAPLLTPEPLDFGFVPLRQRSVQEVVLRNRSDLPVYVEWVQEERSGDDIGALRLEIPETFELAPLEVLTVPAIFQPERAGSAEVRYKIWAKPWPRDEERPVVVLRGTGVEVADCTTGPIPEWTVAPMPDPDATTDALAVRPMTQVRLDASASYVQTPEASLTAYQPVVMQRPPGSTASLEALDGAAPRWGSTIDLVGTYLFGLDVSDSAGQASCRPRVVRVDAAPQGELHVELTWVTPGDRSAQDQGPGAGADLDLHLRRAAEPEDPWIPHDPWIEDPNDCSWSNPAPDWGVVRYGVDDCRVLRADADGWGPEVITLEQTQGRRYAVSVAAGQDWGYGYSLATVRIFVRGELRYASVGKRLEAGQLWQVAEVLPWEGLIEELDVIEASP